MPKMVEEDTLEINLAREFLRDVADCTERDRLISALKTYSNFLDHLAAIYRRTRPNEEENPYEKAKKGLYECVEGVGCKREYAGTGFSMG